MAILWIIPIFIFSLYILGIIDRIHTHLNTLQVRHVWVYIEELHRIPAKLVDGTYTLFLKRKSLEINIPCIVENGIPIRKVVIPYKEISEVKYGGRMAPGGGKIDTMLTITKSNGQYLRVTTSQKYNISFANRVKRRAGLDQVVIEDVSLGTF